MPTELPLSVWPVSQTVPRTQRRGRYLDLAGAHPAKMIPAIAARSITTYTAPGDLVIDVMTGIGTTLVEAVHQGRDAIGIEYEPRWADLAAANLALAAAQGATGHGEVICGDARSAPALIDPAVHGLAALVLTSPPYGPTLHGNLTRRPDGTIHRFDQRYSTDRQNLGNVALPALLDGMRTILAGCTRLLRPGGYLVMTVRPYWHDGRLIDLPGALTQTAQTVGLYLYERNVALLAALRDDTLVPRPSFFTVTQVRKARHKGIPRLLSVHEDILVYRTPPADRNQGGAK